MYYTEVKQKTVDEVLPLPKKEDDIVANQKYSVNSGVVVFLGPKTKNPTVVTSFLSDAEVKSNPNVLKSSFSPLKVSEVVLPPDSGSAKYSGVTFSTIFKGKVFKVMPGKINESGEKVATGKPSGEQWESLIVYNYYKMFKKGDKSEEYKNAAKVGVLYKKTQYEKVAKEIVKSVFNKPDLSLQKLPSEEPTTVRWENYFKQYGDSKPNKTPKTDILVNNKVGYSLKVAETGSQLMSGYKSESLATLQCAIDEAIKSGKIKKSNVSKDTVEVITKALSDPESGYGSYKTIGAVAAKLKKFKSEVSLNLKKYDENLLNVSKNLRNDQASEFLKVINDNKKKVKEYLKDEFEGVVNVLEQKELHAEATTVLNKLVENSDVKLQFIYEAATGTVKFGENSRARALNILEFDSTSGTAKVHKVSSPESMTDYLPLVKFNIGFKTAGVPKSSLRAVLSASDGLESFEEGYSYGFVTQQLKKVYYESYNSTKVSFIEREIEKLVDNHYKTVLLESWAGDLWGETKSYVKRFLSNVEGFFSSLLEKVTNLIVLVYDKYLSRYVKYFKKKVEEALNSRENVLTQLQSVFGVTLDKQSTKIYAPEFLFK